MNTDRAYLMGFQEKLSEYGVTPQEFAKAVYVTGHPQLTKVANALVSTGVKKGRGALEALGQDMAGLAGNIKQKGNINKARSRGLHDTFGAGGGIDVAPTATPGGRKLPQEAPVPGAPPSAQQYTDTPGPRKPSGVINSPEELAAIEAQLNRRIAQGAAGWGGVGTVGAGGIGAGAYGMGDADTMGNRMRNMSNDYLGTDFDTQSRLQALMAQYG